MRSRAYYGKSIPEFIQEDNSAILGQLAMRHEFALEDRQRNAWLKQVEILKGQLIEFLDGFIMFEFSIPRMGKRVDVILILRGLVFVLEFKVGEKSYPKSALDQVLDYSLDLKNFHSESHDRSIIPILISTKAKFVVNDFQVYKDGVFAPLRANQESIQIVLKASLSLDKSVCQISLEAWHDAIYKPTPTIIEAAQALYKGHSVNEISRSDASSINLSKTSNSINRIIEASKKNNRKAICFVTGVPGAGKTLAGLNIANERLKADQGEHAVFLSGNGPLVEVLREALARNEVDSNKEMGIKTTKKDARRNVETFIQNIHHFRDDSLKTSEPPIEKVIVFDEAQRAWTADQTSSFMQRKKGVSDFGMSEPEYLISVLDRHQDWAVAICLIGGGQEINTGEAGLPEWFNAIGAKFSHWNVYVSDQLEDFEYTRNQDLFALVSDNNVEKSVDLHLAVSLRSFRSENLAELVKKILDNDFEKARQLYSIIKENYPIKLTRDLSKARIWLKETARGTERYGVVASSGAYRLRPFGLNVKASIDPAIWFLNSQEDVRSSYFLEEVATEFDIQGLELDWACVAWDANFRFMDGEWRYKNFKGTQWRNVIQVERQIYLKNAYRVLLTRARQGIVIFIPEGNEADETRQPEFYDGTYKVLESIGFDCL